MSIILRSMKSIRVLITDKCNASCSNCINKAIRTESCFIDFLRFKAIAQYFIENNVSRIRIMGGEPTIHPEFREIVSYSQTLFSRVTVFTNGLNNSILDFLPRESDSINYNSRFVHIIPKEHLLLDKPGSRILSIVISCQLNEHEMTSTISRINEQIQNLKVSLTLDCTVNIFKYRLNLLDKFNIIYDFCISHQIEVIVDHGLPICFLYNSQIPSSKDFSKCSENCAGLIDANCNLRFCNQISSESFSLFEGDRIKPFKLINNWLQLAFYQKQTMVLRKICVECPFYGDLCNGGCYMHRELISREDVLQHTELPVYLKHI